MNIRLKRGNEQAWVVDRNAPNFGLPNKIDLPVPEGGYYIEMSYLKTSACITIRLSGVHTPVSRAEVHDGNYLVWNGEKYFEYTPEMFEDEYENAENPVDSMQFAPGKDSENAGR
jgi:hypothetical protein